MEHVIHMYTHVMYVHTHHFHLGLPLWSVAVHNSAVPSQWHTPVLYGCCYLLRWDRL